MKTPRKPPSDKHGRICIFRATPRMSNVTRCTYYSLAHLHLGLRPTPDATGFKECDGDTFVHFSSPISSSMKDISSVINGSLYGYLISLALSGITIVQGWIYIHNNRDKWPLRTFVIVLILLDLTETICSTKVLYHYLVSHFGEFDVLESPAHIISIDFVFTSTIFFIVHLFFAHRLWTTGKNWWLPALIAFTSTATLALGASSVSPQLSRLASSEYYHRRTTIELATFHALAVATDILISIGLSWTTPTTRTGFKITWTILQRILAFTVSRGILVCLVQVGHIVTYILDPKNMLFWSAFHLILTKLYVLTTLATLNSRRSLRHPPQNAGTVESRIAFMHSAMSHIDNNEAGRSLDNPKTSKVPIASLILRRDNLGFSTDVNSKLLRQSLTAPLDTPVGLHSV